MLLTVAQMGSRTRVIDRLSCCCEVLPVFHGSPRFSLLSQRSKGDQLPLPLTWPGGTLGVLLQLHFNW